MIPTDSLIDCVPELAEGVVVGVTAPATGDPLQRAAAISVGRAEAIGEYTGQRRPSESTASTGVVGNLKIESNPYEEAN